MASSSAMRLLLISLLCKVRRADETTLKVFGGHLGECGTNYVQMGCTQDRLLLRGEKKQRDGFGYFNKIYGRTRR